jgi:hypothetical protein
MNRRKVGFMAAGTLSLANASGRNGGLVGRILSTLRMKGSLFKETEAAVHAL